MQADAQTNKHMHADHYSLLRTLPEEIGIAELNVVARIIN